MRHTPFPRSGEPVSKLGFGAMGFAGWFGDANESDWIESLHYALDQGVSFVDTARAYGDSERIVGEALRKWTGAAARRQPSTQSRSTPQLFALRDSSHVDVDCVDEFGRSAERDRGNVGRDRSRGRAVPGSGRTASAARPGLGCVDPARVLPATDGGGRVGRTTELRGCVESRPRLGGTPVSNENAPVECHATGCGPVFAHCHTQRARDHRERYMSRTHAVYVPHPLIKRLATRPALALLSRHLSDRQTVREGGTTASRVGTRR
jgi:hypothetical protein